MADDVSRRAFLRSAAAAGLLGSALTACGDDGPRDAATGSPQAPETSARIPLGRDYLAMGLTALSHAHKRGWARGHHGAAVIAAYYFCEEHALDERTVRALRRQVAAFIQHRRKEFPTIDPGPRAASPERILEQLVGHVAEVGAGVVVHWVTYADALRTLEELGHGDVAKRAYAARRRYVHRRPGPKGAKEPGGAEIDWMGAAYWESDLPRRPQKGTWFFGHSFKLPYSLFRLLRDTNDEARRKACLARAAKLHHPFL